MGRPSRKALWAEVQTWDDVEFGFTFSPLPPIWVGPVKPWATPQFAAHAQWIEHTRDVAIAESRRIEELSSEKLSSASHDRLRVGLRQHAAHALHLLRLVAGKADTPYRSRLDDAWEGTGGSFIESALLKAYGPDPRPAFLAAMTLRGIVPSESRVGAGNVLHRFHVVGDSPPSRNGWAILHRCPCAGSFGSWRTGAVHTWHWRPECMADAREQFAADLARAHADRDSTKGELAA